MSNIIIFEQGGQPVEVRLEGEADWLTQLQMGETFGTTPENVLMHLKRIYAEGELDEAATAKDFLAVRQEGTRQVRRQGLGIREILEAIGWQDGARFSLTLSNQQSI